MSCCRDMYRQSSKSFPQKRFFAPSPRWEFPGEFWPSFQTAAVSEYASVWLRSVQWLHSASKKRKKPPRAVKSKPLWTNKYSVYSLSCFAACQEVLRKVSLVTDLVSGKSNAIGHVHLSVCLFAIYLLNKLTSDLDFFACVLDMTTAHTGLKVKATGQCQCCSRYSCRTHIFALTLTYDKVNAKLCVCHCGVLWALTDGRNSRFLLSRHQLHASAARLAP